MVMLDATPETTVSEVNEEEICECVDNLCQVGSGIIVLRPVSQFPAPCDGIERQTSSHQLIVDVMGAQ
jgi:hypothetical protein